MESIHSQRLCCRLTYLMWMRLTRTSVTPLRKQPKRLSHAGSETTIFIVGMQSVNPSTKLFCSLLSETTQVWLLQLCLPNLTESGGIDGPRQFVALTSHTLVKKPWSFVNNFNGRSRHSPRHCPVSADAIASQLVRNGKYTRLLIASLLDLSINTCLTFGRPRLSLFLSAGAFSL